MTQQYDNTNPFATMHELLTTLNSQFNQQILESIKSSKSTKCIVRPSNSLNSNRSQNSNDFKISNNSNDFNSNNSKISNNPFDTIESSLEEKLKFASTESFENSSFDDFSESFEIQIVQIDDDMNGAKGILFEEEIGIIEKWTEMKLGQIIFDSYKNNWKQDTSVFDSILLNKENVIIVIEDKEGNVFGGYLSCKITNTKYLENNQWSGEYNIDPNSFLFTLRSNLSSETKRKPEKFKVRDDSRSNVFALYHADYESLFRFGNDIMIDKERNESEHFCQEISYEYNGKQNVFVGKTGRDNSFEVKRIVVYQMKETEDTKLQKEIQQKERQEKIKQYLEKRKEEINKNEKYRIEQLQQWSRSTFKEVIFDSEVHDWIQYTSEFDKIIKEKEKIVIQIEDTEGNVFGGYIQRKIDQYVLDEHGKNGELMDDYHTFVFSLRSGGRYYRMHKCDIINEEFSFVLYKQDDERLFSIGLDEITIMKKNMKEMCRTKCEQFNYNGKCDLFGKKDGSERRFEVKRIQVYQMEQTEEQENEIKREKQMKIKEKEMRLQKKNESFKEKLRNEIEQLEKWSFTTFETLLFDSNINSWKLGRDDFIKAVQKNHIIFLLEDTEGNMFGAYIDCPLVMNNNKSVRNVNLNDNALIIVDDVHALVFRLHTKGEMKDCERYRIMRSKQKKACKIYKPHDERMFTIGNNDIVIMKEENKTKCSLQQNSFDYKELKDTLRGPEQSNEFELKRIRVLKMSQTKSQRDARNYDELTREEKEKLYYQEATEAVKQLQSKRKDKIEEVTNLTFQQVVYDSDLLHNRDNIEIETLQSVLFKEDVISLQHIVLLCEDNLSNVFGCYLEQPNYLIGLSREERMNSRKRILDWNTSLFIVEKHAIHLNCYQYQMKDKFINTPTVFTEENKKFTISVGKGEFEFVQNKDKMSFKHSSEHYFSYDSNTMILNRFKSFEVKRFQVWKMCATTDNQWKDKNDIKTKKENKITQETMNSFEMEKLDALSKALSPSKSHLRQVKLFSSKPMKIIRQLEEWTGKQFMKVLFASEFSVWEEGRSVFDGRFSKTVTNHVILFEDYNGLSFGVYLTVPLDKKCDTNTPQQSQGIIDENAFVFSFQTKTKKNPEMYKLKDKYKTVPVCYLFDQYCENLIQIGENDLIVKKGGMNSIYNQNEKSSFDYGNVKNALVGNKSDDSSFNVKNVCIYQFGN